MLPMVMVKISRKIDNCTLMALNFLGILIIHSEIKKTFTSEKIEGGWVHYIHIYFNLRHDMALQVHLSEILKGNRDIDSMWS